MCLKDFPLGESLKHIFNSVKCRKFSDNRFLSVVDANEILVGKDVKRTIYCTNGMVFIENCLSTDAIYVSSC